MEKFLYATWCLLPLLLKLFVESKIYGSLGLLLAVTITQTLGSTCPSIISRHFVLLLLFVGQKKNTGMKTQEMCRGKFSFLAYQVLMASDSGY
jgi:hypothetical protein